MNQNSIPENYSINWSDEDTVECIRSLHINDIIINLFRFRHPEEVKRIEQLVDDREKSDN